MGQSDPRLDSRDPRMDNTNETVDDTLIGIMEVNNFSSFVLDDVAVS